MRLKLRGLSYLYENKAIMPNLDSDFGWPQMWHAHYFSVRTAEHGRLPACPHLTAGSTWDEICSRICSKWPISSPKLEICGCPPTSRPKTVKLPPWSITNRKYAACGWRFDLDVVASSIPEKSGCSSELKCFYRCDWILKSRNNHLRDVLPTSFSTNIQTHGHI